MDLFRFATFYIGSTDSYDAWRDPVPTSFEVGSIYMLGVWEGQIERVRCGTRNVQSVEHAERIAADISAVTGNTCVLLVMRARHVGDRQGWARAREVKGKDVDRSKSFSATDRNVYQWVPDVSGDWAATLVYANGDRVPLD